MTMICILFRPLYCSAFIIFQVTLRNYDIGMTCRINRELVD